MLCTTKHFCFACGHFTFLNQLKMLGTFFSNCHYQEVGHASVDMLCSKEFIIFAATSVTYDMTRMPWWMLLLWQYQELLITFLGTLFWKFECIYMNPFNTLQVGFRIWLYNKTRFLFYNKIKIAFLYSSSPTTILHGCRLIVIYRGYFLKISPSSHGTSLLPHLTILVL